MEFKLVILGTLNLSLFILSAIAKSECDTIRFKPTMAWFKTNYWLGLKDISKRNWWFKYPLSFAYDGWHLMDSTRNTLLVLILLMPYIVFLEIAWYWVVLSVILLYAFYGIVFEIFYQN